MPTYAYACTDCGHRLEVVQKFTDTTLTECPACHGRLRKVFYPVGVVFKGSGFYRTDSRAPAKEPAAAGGKADATSDGATKSADKSPSVSGNGAKQAKESTPKKPASTPAA